MSNEATLIPSLLTQQATVSHTNGSTVQPATGRYSHQCMTYLFRSFFFLAETANSFAWGTYLKTTGSHAAPVHHFLHVNEISNDSFN